MNKVCLVFVGNGLTLMRTIISGRKTGIAGIRPWPKSIFERTDNGLDKRLVGMVLEVLFKAINLDWCGDLEEIWILRDCFTSNFVLELVFGR